MKPFFLFLFLAVSTYSYAQNDVVYVDANQHEESSSTTSSMWESSFERATKLAKKEHKPILIFFSGSDWCGPCKMLTADFFDSYAFKKRAKEMVLYEADFPRDRTKLTKEQRKINAKLGTIYNVRSYPTIIMINSEGDELGRQKGYTLLRETKDHFAFLDRNLSH